MHLHQRHAEDGQRSLPGPAHPPGRRPRRRPTGSPASTITSTRGGGQLDGPPAARAVRDPRPRAAADSPSTTSSPWVGGSRSRCRRLQHPTARAGRAGRGCSEQRRRAASRSPTPAAGPGSNVELQPRAAAPLRRIWRYGVHVSGTAPRAKVSQLVPLAPWVGGGVRTSPRAAGRVCHVDGRLAATTLSHGGPAAAAGHRVVDALGRSVAVQQRWPSRAKIARRLKAGVFHR